MIIEIFKDGHKEKDILTDENRFWEIKKDSGGWLRWRKDTYKWWWIKNDSHRWSQIKKHFYKWSWIRKGSNKENGWTQTKISECGKKHWHGLVKNNSL